MKNCDECWDIETALLRGSDALIVIKTGAGGTVNGYMDKYKKLAEYIHHRTGYAVLTVDNPVGADKEENFEVTMTAAEFANDVTEAAGGGEVPVYYIGFSLGASLGAMYGWQYPYIRKMLLINPPLMINWHRQRNGLEQFDGEQAVVAIGSSDPSYQFAGLIDCIDNPCVEKTILYDTGHNLSVDMNAIIFGMLFSKQGDMP